MMKSRSLSSWLIEIIPPLLILLFVYTAINKLIDHRLFVHVLMKSPLIGEKARLVSWLVPILELFAAIQLLFPRFRKKGLLLSLVLMSLFTAYIGYMIVFVPHLPCSCGGILKSLSWPQHLAFNIIVLILIAACLLMYELNKDFIAINRRSRKPVQPSRRSIFHSKFF